MTPQDFIKKWKPVALTERATAQEHFIDLCRLFDHPTPIEDDPVGEHFAFEKGASKIGGGDGWADVWKKGFFAWEYKKKKRDLDKAMEQLTHYAAGLENPPIHVACDTHIFRIGTRWTNEASATYEFELEDLADPANFNRLRAVFHNPAELRSGRTRSKLTKEAADKFQTISDSLQHRNPDREAVAHFVNQLVFCFFADSVKLLPEGMWKKLLQTAERRPERAKQWLDQLFGDMKDGGDFNLEHIAWFNGGLFDGRPALELTHVEIALLFAAATLDWSLIDPTIFGTLFERFLDPDKRAQIGAHYTDPDKIMKIVEPVVLRPLRAEWETAKARIEALMAPVLEAAGANGRNAKRDLGKRFDAARAKAEAERDAFIDRLCAVRILDPACGSGNFLYLDRILPKTAEAAVKLKARTLTNLYNERPRWLADAHDALDRAVAAAYGWPEDISTDDALARLLALNLERARAREG
jgi:MmeI, N-terminal domain/MmeI, helicase spacer domain